MHDPVWQDGDGDARTLSTVARGCWASSTASPSRRASSCWATSPPRRTSPRQVLLTDVPVGCFASLETGSAPILGIASCLAVARSSRAQRPRAAAAPSSCAQQPHAAAAAAPCQQHSRSGRPATAAARGEYLFRSSICCSSSEAAAARRQQQQQIEHLCFCRLYRVI